MAVGPLYDGSETSDWAGPYYATGGAAYTYRRTLKGMEQQLETLKDWYRLVYVYGVHPYVAHRAFLLIDEYQTIIKDAGCGPDKGEPGHVRGISYGRAHLYPVPEFSVRTIGRSTHFLLRSPSLALAG